MSTRIPMVLAIATAVPACRSDAPLFSAHRVESQPDAGSVHFAVLSVAPWDEYVQDLQPDFDLDADQALAKVLPSTRGQQDWMLRVIELLAGARSTRKLERGRERLQRQGLEVETELPDAVEPPGGSDADTIGVPASEGEDFGEKYLREAGYAVADPMSLYWAATALYQEVKLLNRYVQDAAILRDYRPYVVRMQVGLMPLARGEPYDAYSTISFFCAPPAETGVSVEASAAASQAEREAGDSQDRSLEEMTAQPFTGPGPRNTPRVVPLMATDNLEASTQSRSRQAIEQFAAALDYFATGLTGAASAQNLTSRVQQVLGHDLNSLLSVMRVSDNTLRVRLGALQQGSANFAMVPRNHNITVLLMLPKDSGATVQVVAKTSMVDAETGQELPERREADFRRRLQAVIDFHELSGLTPEDLGEPLRCAQMNDQQGFEQAFERLIVKGGSRKLPHHAYARALWLDLVSLMVGSQYTATEFDVPPESTPVVALVPDCVPEQTALVFDSPQAGTTVVLGARGAPPVPVEEIRAALVVKQASGDVRLASAPVEYRFESGELRSAFPSLASLGLATGGKPAAPILLVLEWGSQRAEFAGLYVAGSPP